MDFGEEVQHGHVVLADILVQLPVGVEAHFEVLVVVAQFLKVSVVEGDHFRVQRVFFSVRPGFGITLVVVYGLECGTQESRLCVVQVAEVLADDQDQLVEDHEAF